MLSTPFATIDLGRQLLVSVPSALALAVLFYFVSLIYSREATPLRKVPGPVLASFSRLWLALKTRKRNRHELDLELHKKYGTVVRIGPTHVSISSPDAIKTIYGTSA